MRTSMLVLLMACIPEEEKNENNSTEEAWFSSSHPCVGNRTDALWCDDASTCFVGCGSTTNGQGLYSTVDGGATWSEAETNPSGFFDTMRVNSISRSNDGLLYIGGTGSNNARVISMADDGTLAYVHESAGQTWNSFQVGTFRRADDGSAIAESLTGTDVVYRSYETEAFVSGYGWWADYEPNGLQILDMETHNGDIFGCGSTINSPPYVMIPSENNLFQAVQLASGLAEFKGEMWGIDVDDNWVVVGGVNQERDVGMLYYIERNGVMEQEDAWTAIDISDYIASDSTWVRDVCVLDSDSIVALVEDSRSGEGYVLQFNTDDTYEDLTNYDGGESEFPVLSRCSVVDGTLLVAGANGWFASHQF